MRHNAKAAHVLGRLEGGPQRKLDEASGVAPPLPGPIDCDLSEQRDRDGIRLVALTRLGKERPFDLPGAERNVADDPARFDMLDHAHSRRAADVVAPAMAAEPCVPGPSAA